jgi:hypothetical protein
MKQPNQHDAQAGIGVVIMLQDKSHCSEIHVAAMSPPATSALQAEASSGLQLAIAISEVLNLQQPYFLSDNVTLVKAAASLDIINKPGHWEIRPQLARIIQSNQFEASKTFHVPRSLNFKAHYNARLALKLQGRSANFRCITGDLAQGLCPIRTMFYNFSDHLFSLCCVKCC